MVCHPEVFKGHLPITHIATPTITGMLSNNQPPKATRHPGVVLVMNPLPVLPVKSPNSSLAQVWNAWHTVIPLTIFAPGSLVRTHLQSSRTTVGIQTGTLQPKET